MSTSKAAKPKPIHEQLDELFAPRNRSDAPGVAVGVAKDGGIGPPAFSDPSGAAKR